MTLRELWRTTKSRGQWKNFIGIYEEDDNGRPLPITPDFADEIMETHADYIVKEHVVTPQGLLVVEFAE